MFVLSRCAFWVMPVVFILFIIIFVHVSGHMRYAEHANIVCMHHAGVDYMKKVCKKIHYIYIYIYFRYELPIITSLISLKNVNHLGVLSGVNRRLTHLKDAVDVFPCRVGSNQRFRIFAHQVIDCSDDFQHLISCYDPITVNIIQVECPLKFFVDGSSGKH